MGYRQYLWKRETCFSGPDRISMALGVKIDFSDLNTYYEKRVIKSIQPDWE
jgi:hypothetical protein